MVGLALKVDASRSVSEALALHVEGMDSCIANRFDHLDSCLSSADKHLIVVEALSVENQSTLVR